MGTGASTAGPIRMGRGKKRPEGAAASLSSVIKVNDCGVDVAVVTLKRVICSFDVPLQL